jgi:hypothetical protein
MSNQQLAQKQYAQAKQAAGKLEDWRLKEIRYELRIDLGRQGSKGETSKPSAKK